MTTTTLLPEAFRRAAAGEGATRAEALALTGEEVPLEALLDAADAVREEHFGKTIRFCAIVNARCGACSEDCAFCAQSARHGTRIEAYPLRDAEAILQAARDHRDSGADTFGIVTSGPTVGENELGPIAEAVGRMESESGLRPCASLGRLDAGAFARLRDAGLRRYHHNLETSRRFYPSICTTHRWEERLATLRAARDAGLEVCSGGLFGLGETWEDRVDLALTLREEGVKSVPLNFLHPVPGTPLAESEPLGAREALRTIALYRLLLPTATIRVCGGRPLILKDAQEQLFRAGANALMTGHYLTTPGFDPAADRALVEGLGLVLE